MLTSSTGATRARPGAEQGFTLFELMVAAVIIIAMGIAALPSALGLLADRAVWGTGRLVVRMSALARESAVDLAGTCALHYSPEKGLLTVEAPAATPGVLSQYGLPRGVDVEFDDPQGSLPAASAVSVAAEGEWTVAFEPDGTCGSGTVLITGSRGEECAVVFEPNLGVAKVEPVDAGE